MTAPYEKATLAGYTVEPNGFGPGFFMYDPDGDETGPNEGYPTEAAAWEAADNHRMFGHVLGARGDLREAGYSVEAPRPDMPWSARFNGGLIAESLDSEVAAWAACQDHMEARNDPHAALKAAGYTVNESRGASVLPPYQKTGWQWNHDASGAGSAGYDSEAAAWAGAEHHRTHGGPVIHPTPPDAAAERLRLFGDERTPAPVLQTVVVSLTHLTLATVERLKGPHESWPICGGRFGDDRFTVYATPDDDGEMPRDLFAVTSWAAANGFDRIEFDPEREPFPALKVYDHAPREPVDALEAFAKVRDLFATWTGWSAYSEGYDPDALLEAIAEAVGAGVNNKPAAPVAPTPAENCAQYMDALDEMEIPPNGDDCNALYALALGGDYQPPHKGGR